jgi:Fur family peroxide stress response transcriptional regulator
MTVQRRAVLEALAGRGDHPTAEQVHAAVRGRVPGMSRATVYRVLETLAGWGVARRVDHAGTPARFEVDSGAHHHLVCLGCGRIRDVRDSALLDLPVRPPRVEGFRVRDFTIQFRGLCRRCRRRGAAQERSHR